MVAHLSIIQGEAATDAELADAQRIKPQKRGECEGQSGVCPLISCRHHLLLDISRQGHLQLNGLSNKASDDEIIDRLLEMEHTCALDVVDEKPDGMDRAGIGRIMGLSRERVRHLERHTSGEALMDGFAGHFGERRPIADSAYGNGPASGGRRAPAPVSQAFPKHLRRRAVSHFRKTGDRAAAAALVEHACGRRPKQDLIPQWAAKLDPKHASKGMKRKALELREQGMTFAQIGDALADEFGKKPHENSISRWVKSARKVREARGR